jgi:hypothetical protein
MDKEQILAGRERLVAALAPVVAHVRGIDPSHPDAAARLGRELPLDAPEMVALAALVREGVEAGWLCEKEAGGVRFSRVAKAEHPGTSPHSLDAVHMTGPGPGHEHPQGEIDLCFAVTGAPTFDGHPAGWVVYPPGSWHVPTVEGGAMDILYFLPDGAIRFGPPS